MFLFLCSGCYGFKKGFDSQGNKNIDSIVRPGSLSTDKGISKMSSITSFITLRTTGPQLGMRGDMPTLSDSTAYTTPPVTVPANNDNPYIVREHNPNGTVFIAVGCIVGAILLAFIMYHLIRSLAASKLAKKTLASDKELYEKYQHNNNYAYGGNISPHPSVNFSEYQHHTKLPLLSHNRDKSLSGILSSSGDSQTIDGSGIYGSEVGATSKHDLTKMFFSPTEEVMQNRKNKISRGHNLMNGSVSTLANPPPASNWHSQVLPSLYINKDINNSDYSILHQASQSNSHIPDEVENESQPSAQRGRNGKGVIPSMYLEDLIDKQ